MKELKIEIFNEDHSRFVQGLLFELGCRRGIVGREIVNCQNKSLCVCDGYIFYNPIPAFDDKDITTDQLIKMVEEKREGDEKEKEEKEEKEKVESYYEPRKAARTLYAYATKDNVGLCRVIFLAGKSLNGFREAGKDGLRYERAQEFDIEYFK